MDSSISTHWVLCIITFSSFLNSFDSPVTRDRVIGSRGTQVRVPRTVTVIGNERTFDI